MVVGLYNEVLIDAFFLSDVIEYNLVDTSHAGLQYPVNCEQK